MKANSVFTFTLAFSGGLLSLWLSGCSSETKTRCGEGTELIAKECVPIADGAVVEAAPDGGGGAVDAGATESCGADTVLVDGECKGLGPVGAACKRGAECASGTCLPESDGLPGGYCSLPSCNERRPCPSGSHCYYSSARDRTVCLAFCDYDDECRDGYVCQPIYGSGVNVCTPACDTVQACPDQTECDSKTGKCVLRECDPKAKDPCDTAASNRICYPDPKGLTNLGGLCLTLCDPMNPSAACKTMDVCQPLPDDPANQGFCTVPVCTKDEECPLGATCANQVCQPPARCDDNGACADSTTACVGGAFGQCMPLCPSDGGSCADMRAGLVCAQSVAAQPVCLPLGSFPGSACRSDKNSPCDPVRLPGSTDRHDMVCENDTCLLECKDGGTPLCGGLASDLRCVSGIFADAVCLPDGAYPGGPCGGDSHDACVDADLGAGVSAKMTCRGGKCLFDCGDGATSGVDGTTYCAGIDGGLSCATDIYPGAAVCLPEGSFPGGPCTHGACSSVNGVAMTCENDRCLLTCESAQDHCAEIDASLVCAHGVFALDVCLPVGSFPGGPCAGSGHDQCSDAELGGGASAHMLCRGDKCLFDCSAGAIGNIANGETFCGGIDDSLTCASGIYPDTFVCLPVGSFPGGPCVRGTCSPVNGVEQTCEDNRCLLKCNPSDDHCADIDASLVCAHGVFNADVCLPIGSFPGGPCAGENHDTCVPADLGGGASAQMLCLGGRCLLDCSAGAIGNVAGDTFCGGVDSSLTCASGVYPSASVCLPDGSFPGGPCVRGTCSPVNGNEQACEANRCLLTCKPVDHCSSFGADLVCAHGVYDTDVCLPAGTFPGGPCTGSNSDVCDDVDLGGGATGHMLCRGSKCLFDCSGGAIGSAPSGESFCAGIDDSLTCTSSVYPSTTVCLPEGSFPGGPCSHGACDAVNGVPMACENNVCLVECNAAGQDICPAFSSSLICAHGVYGEDVCLPQYSFPGSPCTGPSQCAQDLNGNPALDMKCSSTGRCVVDCTAGEAICQVVNSALTCAQAAGSICVPACTTGTCASGSSCLDPGTIPTHENACLPNGTFPGSTCRSGSVCDAHVGGGSSGPAMTCTSSNVCAVVCAGADAAAKDAMCAMVSSALTCADAPNICVQSCESTACATGTSCLDPGSSGHQHACLPNGSFPGSTCATGNACGNTPVPMVCVGTTCLIDCSNKADGNGYCASLNLGLTTCHSPGSYCTP